MRSFALLCLFGCCLLEAQVPQMLKSLSGPSGHVSGPKFVFDETRTRFVYPRDKSLIVYFEWATPPGLHTISAVWKAPDGRPASIPADIKIELASGVLASYWTFDISPADASGLWTLETRVDGAPGGSHTFEIYVPPTPKETAEVKPTRPTTDEVYRAAVPSLAIVASLDASGQHLDSSMGFVYARDRVLTAFQGIDGASAILVMFSDGTTAQADSLAGWNRSGDWALIPVPTAARKALVHSSSAAAKIGERVLAFTSENGKTPVAATVDLSGRTRTAFQFNPALPPISAGSPVFGSEGDVIGIAGAWDIPGSRVPLPVQAVNQTVWGTKGNVSGITPIEAVEALPAPVPLRHLFDSGEFTPPLERFPSLMYATTSDVPSKRSELPDRNVTEFPLKISTAWVVSMWTRREKPKSAMISTAVFDIGNRKRGQTAPKKVPLGDTPYRLTNSFAVSALEPGPYRVDLIADGKAVWRCFIKVVE